MVLPVKSQKRSVNIRSSSSSNILCCTAALSITSTLRRIKWGVYENTLELIFLLHCSELWEGGQDLFSIYIQSAFDSARHTEGMKCRERKTAAPQDWKLVWCSQLSHVAPLLDISNLTGHPQRTRSLWDGENKARSLRNTKCQTPMSDFRVPTNYSFVLTPACPLWR